MVQTCVMSCFVLTDIILLFIVTYPGNNFHTYVECTLHNTNYCTLSLINLKVAIPQNQSASLSGFSLAQAEEMGPHKQPDATPNFSGFDQLITLCCWWWIYCIVEDNAVNRQQHNDECKPIPATFNAHPKNLTLGRPVFNLYFFLFSHRE